MFPSKISILVILQSAIFITAQQTDLLKPCRMDDLECIRDTTQQFLEKTSKGIPQFGVKAIDPLVVEKLEYNLTEFGAAHNITNLKISGLKDVQVREFQMDTVNKMVTISLNMSVVSDGDIAATYHVKPERKTVTGHVTANFKFVAITRYPYSVQEGENGTMHYVVGDEVTTFSLRDVPTYELNKAFLDAVNADPQLVEARSKVLATKRAEFVRAVAKELVDVIVSALVHNLRQAAKFLPMSAFFVSN